MAIWLDYGLLGVTTLPVDVVLQRMFTVVALGLIAGGAARRAARDVRRNDLLIAGALLWATVLGGRTGPCSATCDEPACTREVVIEWEDRINGVRSSGSGRERAPTPIRHQHE